MARILLGVCGGIAAYKAAELVRLATERGHAVRVVQTPTSLRFVGRATFEAITGAPVLVDEFEPDPLRGAYPGEEMPRHQPISHLALVERCDVYCIAPATANTIAKLVAGQADSLVTTAALACRAPVVVAPAMNDAMWRNVFTSANVERLRAAGIVIVEPETGRLASLGEWGAGRLADPERILAVLESTLTGGRGRSPEPAALPARGEAQPSALAGKRVLVTAGGTREPLDAVRFIGNRSSGRMGVALAAAAHKRGACVTLVGANLAVPPPVGVEHVAVETVAELSAALDERFPSCDVLLMAAAVSDFRPADAARVKLERCERLAIELEPTEDIVAGLASQRRAEQLVVGFAAEHGGDFVARARTKLARKGLDAIVANDVSVSGIGFDSTENAVVIVTADGVERRVERQAKSAVAEAILDEVERLLATRAPR